MLRNAKNTVGKLAAVFAATGTAHGHGPNTAAAALPPPPPGGGGSPRGRDLSILTPHGPVSGDEWGDTASANALRAYRRGHHHGGAAFALAPHRRLQTLAAFDGSRRVWEPLDRARPPGPSQFCRGRGLRNPCCRC